MQNSMVSNNVMKFEEKQNKQTNKQTAFISKHLLAIIKRESVNWNWGEN